MKSSSAASPRTGACSSCGCPEGASWRYGAHGVLERTLAKCERWPPQYKNRCRTLGTVSDEVAGPEAMKSLGFGGRRPNLANDSSSIPCAPATRDGPSSRTTRGRPESATSHQMHLRRPVGHQNKSRHVFFCSFVHRSIYKPEKRSDLARHRHCSNSAGFGPSLNIFLVCRSIDAQTNKKHMPRLGLAIKV